MILKGKTQKGKNRIRENGAEWILIRAKDRVIFSNKPGPWWLIEPITNHRENSRWVHSTDDIDFEIVKND